MTLIEAEVCESFEPPLVPDEHRRNVVTRGIELNRLVGQEFTIGEIRCRGMRLCEPCTVVQRYAGRPVLRELVHRGGLRADILEGGLMRRGDTVHAISATVWVGCLDKATQLPWRPTRHRGPPRRCRSRRRGRAHVRASAMSGRALAPLVSMDELPMAPASCTLDRSGLGKRLSRYRLVGHGARVLRDGPPPAGDPSRSRGP